MDSKEFLSDLTVSLDIVGSPTILNPFLQFTSSQRSLMFSANMPQAMVCHGNEIPRILSGFENKFGRYEFSTCTRNQDIQILKVIPKFNVNRGHNTIKDNPTLTIIYLGLDDGIVGTCDINAYTELSSGFGYMNKRLHSHLIQENQVIEKEVKFITSPNHMDEQYCMGINANVCFIPTPETSEDAFVISKSFAKKCEHTVVDSVTFTIGPDDIPLNIYGSNEEYKCFPDVGEVVNSQGILLALRSISKNSFLADLTPEQLATPEFLHDEIHVAPPGAEIIDIQIFTNSKKYAELTPSGIYGQMLRYQDQYHSYWGNIVDVYTELKKEGYKFSPAMINLVTKCKGWCYHKAGKNMILMNKKEPIEFIQLKIVYAFTRKIGPGFKLTDRQGAKGVVSKITDDEDMPRTDQGLVADIGITGSSPFNRLNGGQYYEQFLNCAAHKVQQDLINNAWNSIEEQYEYALGFMHEVRPVYAKYIREQTVNSKAKFIKTIIDKGFYFIIPPFSGSIAPEMFIRIAKKYNVRRSPISYRADTPDGKMNVRTNYKSLIGSKYVFLLGKIPIDQTTCVEFGFVNQLLAPIKPGAKSIKSQSIVGQTPIRYGEDENAILTMSCGAEFTSRFLGIYGNSPFAQRQLQLQLLNAKHPTAIRSLGMTTQEVLDTCVNVGCLKHQLAAAGLEIKTKRNKESL